MLFESPRPSLEAQDVPHLFRYNARPARHFAAVAAGRSGDLAASDGSRNGLPAS